MGQYAFPRLIMDAGDYTVKVVLAGVLEGFLREEGRDPISYVSKYFADRDLSNEDYDYLALSKEESEHLSLEPSELNFRSLFYLLFDQTYSGFERSNKLGALNLIISEYDLTDEDLDNVWMCLYIYETAQEQIEKAQEANESTWADERALDLIKLAMEPFGDSVDLLMAPYEKALEAQNDLRRAGQGDPDSMLELSYQLIEGKGVKKNLTEAEKWARLAADSDTPRRQEAETVADFLQLMRERRN